MFSHLSNAFYVPFFPSVGMTRQAPTLTRDEKVVNLMTNYTILFASMFEDAFADLAAKMTEVTVGMGEAIAGAMSEGLSGESDGGAEAEETDGEDQA